MTSAPKTSPVFAAISSNLFSARSLVSSESVLTVPLSKTVCGITLKAFEDVSNEVTETTIWSMGSAFRLTMDCNAITMCDPTIVGSTVICGLAACPPSPFIVISKKSDAAKNGPALIANLPISKSGQLCMPYTSCMPKRSIKPSSHISRPPPPPSSAGWKMTTAVPSKLRVSARYLAAPRSIAV